jgi:N-acetylglucosaminyl-diphospho-decaprenol L-rhamnosyltransferase
VRSDDAGLRPVAAPGTERTDVSDGERQWAAVVVNFEAGPLLLDCVRSLLADESAGTPEVVVVDNGSIDGSVASLRRALPDVTVIDSGGNAGYAAAANRGIAATSAPVIAVANPDLVVEPGTAGALLGRLGAEPDLAAVGPALHNPDGSQYPSARAHVSTVDAVGHAVLGRMFPRNRFTRRYRQLDAAWARPRDVDWVSGAFVFLRRSALESVGGWDERYFMYMEDVDLCWRLRRIGWRVAYEPGGRATHVQGASTASHPYRMIAEHHRSAYRFADRRWRGARRLLLVPAACFLALRAMFDMAARALRARSETPRVSG